MKDKLFDCLSRIRSQNEIHLLIITGDITYQGGYYTQKVYNFLSNVAQILDIKNKEQIFIVPGNHDLRRTPVREGIIDSILGSTNPMESASELNDETLKTLLKDQNAYFNFYKKFLGRSYPRVQSHLTLESDHYRIIHLNTCNLSGKKDEEGKLYLGLNRLYETLKKVDGDSKINIAIGHHSLDCIVPKEKQQIIHNFCDHNIDLYLCGHMHQTSYAFDNQGDRIIPVFTCGANMVDDNSKANFLVGEVNLKAKLGKMTYYSWQEDNAYWSLDNSVGRSIRNGSIYFKFSRFDNNIGSDEIKNFFENRAYNEISIISNIEKQKYPKVINYLPRQVVPSSTSELSLLFTDSMKDLKDVLFSNKRVVLLGDAGVGKSTELERIAGLLSEEKEELYPFFVSFKDYVNESIEELIPEEWKNISPDRVLIILDGLDEVESKNKNDAIRRITTFCKTYNDVRMVISCRSNFYRIETSDFPGTIAGFESYKLLELRNEQIESYVEENLGLKANNFNLELAQKQLTELISIPFYLTNLVHSYATNDKLPNSRAKLFEELLQGRIHLDEIHFEDLADDRQLIKDKLEFVALAMETLERNYITEDEFQQLIPEAEIRKLVMCCSEFVKVDKLQGASWQFGHSNFQEYLAAKRLVHQPIEVIKDFTSFKPDYKKIKPSWVNTLSFIIGMDENKELSKWVLEIEPELAIKFEPDRFDPKQRFDIFVSIFNYYKEKHIPIDLEKYRLGELARFGQTSEIITFLFDELQTNIERSTIENALLLLSGMKPIYQVAKIQEFLVQKIISGELGNVGTNRALILLANWGIDSKNIEIIAYSLKDSENDWIRYGLYYFLDVTKHVDDYIEIFLDGIKYINRNKIVSEGRLGNELFQLRVGLSNVQAITSLKKMLSHFILNPSDLEQIFYGKDIEKVIKNLLLDWEKDKIIWSLVYNLCIALLNSSEELKARYFVKFFFLSNTSYEAFTKTFNEAKGLDYYFNLLSFLSNEASLDFYVQEYLARNVANDEVSVFLKHLNKELAKKLLDKINMISKIKFEFEEEINYEEFRKLKRQKDFDSLFDKQKFMDRLEYIFNLVGQAEFKLNELYNLKEYRWNSENHSELIFRLLHLWGDIINAEKIKKWISSNWNEWSIDKIHEYFIHSSFDILVSDAQKEMIIKYCMQHYSKVNFKTAFIEKDGTYSYNDVVALRIWTFYKKFKISLPKTTLLDMLSFDWIEGNGFRGINYLEKNLGLTDITIRILQNLKDGVSSGRVLINYLQFTQKHGIQDIVPYAKEILKNNLWNDEVREIALDTLVKLNTNIDFLAAELEDIQGNFKWKLIEILSNNPRLHTELKDYLKNALKESLEDDENFRIADLLLKIQDVDGLIYYSDWIKQNNRVPNTISEYVLSQMRNSEAIPLLIELYELSCQEKFMKDKYNRLGLMCLDALSQIATLSEINYHLVKAAVFELISKKEGTLSNVNYLHLFLDKLERKYYSSISEQFTLPNAKQQVSSLF